MRRDVLVLAAAVANSVVHVLAAAVANSDVHVLAAAVTNSDVHVPAACVCLAHAQRAGVLHAGGLRAEEPRAGVGPAAGLHEMRRDETR